MDIKALAEAAGIGYLFDSNDSHYCGDRLQQFAESVADHARLAELMRCTRACEAVAERLVYQDDRYNTPERVIDLVRAEISDNRQR